jgi:Protein of Unknown function (DUF2604)
MSPENTVQITIVVSGQPVPLHVNVHQTLEHVVHDALQNSGNKGQSPSDWELRLEGRLLDQSETVGAAGITSGMTLFLSPRAGAGG